MQNLKREVALLALPVLTFLGVLLVHLIHANAITATWVEALFVALGTGLAAAFATPPHPQLIGGAVVTALTICGHYWWHFSTAELQQAIIVINLLFGVSVSHRITPRFP